MIKNMSFWNYTEETEANNSKVSDKAQTNLEDESGADAGALDDDYDDDDHNEIEKLVACSNKMEGAIKCLLTQQKENFLPVSGYERIIVEAFRKVCPSRRRTIFNKIMDLIENKP